MSVDLRAAAVEHLANRRARGYRLADHDRLIAAFLGDLEARGITAITVADALAFALRGDTQRDWQAKRLRAVQGLAGYVHGIDPAAAELIPAGLIPAKVSRKMPYLYSSEQIELLMVKAATLCPPRLAAGMRALIGLLAVTGLRSGEAVALDVEDLDMDRGLLTVTGKNGKQRILPLHPTTVAALAGYVRDTRAAPQGPLLLGARGGRLNPNTARACFRALTKDCRLPARPGCRAPRLHDLRHSFAVEALIAAHRENVDADARVAALANYLGHVDPTCTYWYLTASPRLMATVRNRITTHQRRSPA